MNSHEDSSRPVVVPPCSGPRPAVLLAGGDVTSIPRCFTILLGAVLLLALSPVVAKGQAVPEVVAVKQREELRVGAEVVTWVTPQDLLTVVMQSPSNPGWLWVRTEKAGWIALDKVGPVPPDQIPSDVPSTKSAGEAEKLAGWLTGANAGLMHEQVGLLAELLQVSPASRERVQARAELLVKHCDRTLSQLELLEAANPTTSSSTRSRELLTAIRTESQALLDLIRNGTTVSNQQFAQAAQRAQSLLTQPPSSITPLAP